MKKLIGVFMLGVVLFAASAGVSWFLKQGEHHADEDASARAGDKISGDKSAKGVPGALPGLTGADNSRGALRPSPNPTPENVVALAANLRQQQELLSHREQQLLSRQKNLELIYQDLKSERKSLDDVRQQISEEMRAIQEKMESLEKRASDVEKQKQKMSDQAREIKQTMFDFEGVEQARIKQMASMYDSMEPESAADILQHMADVGKMDTAVKILATMRERQAARVLAQIPDRAMVAQFLERLKGLRRPATPGP